MAASDSPPDASANGSSSDHEEQAHNLLEWTVSAIGALLTIGTMVYLVVQISTGAGAPPVLKVTLGEAELQGQTVLVPVTVANEGGSVAADVTVEVCASDASCSQIMFQYVPHEATRSGRVGLEAPIASFLDAHIVSYRLP